MSTHVLTLSKQAGSRQQKRWDYSTNGGESDTVSSTETIDLNTGNYTWIRTINRSGSALCPNGQTLPYSLVDTVNETATLPITLSQIPPPINQILNYVSGSQQYCTNTQPYPQYCFVGQALPQPLIVKVTDPSGNPVGGVEVNFQITMSPPGASETAALTDPTVTSGPNGTASTGMTLGSLPGKYEVTAGCNNCLVAPVGPPAPVVGIKFVAAAAPLPTLSYYVKNPNTATLYAVGVKDAEQLTSNPYLPNTALEDVAIILLFGGPEIDNTSTPPTYGVSTYAKLGGFVCQTPESGFHFCTDQEVANLVEGFITGFYSSLGGFNNLHATIIIGTNNSTGPANVTQLAGQAWAQMVGTVADWVTNHGYSYQVAVAGGNNLEPDFGAYSDVQNWLDGYFSVSPQQAMYNIGAMNGCSPAKPQAPCGKFAWTPDDLYQASWGAFPNLLRPIPELYSRTLANQWQQLAAYAIQQADGQGFSIAGTLTQQGACDQLFPTNDPTCLPETRISSSFPAQGWTTLYDILAGNPNTAQTPERSSDIQYLNPPPH